MRFAAPRSPFLRGLGEGAMSGPSGAGKAFLGLPRQFRESRRSGRRSAKTIQEKPIKWDVTKLCAILKGERGRGPRDSG